jgi:hypothetical protein
METRAARTTLTSVNKSDPRAEASFCTTNGPVISFNAVRIQLLSAIAVYTLVAIAKKQWALPHYMHQILQVPISTLFKQAEPDCLSTALPIQLSNDI